jgi:type IV secretion system protein VirB2
LFACGAVLVFGGEMTEFVKRALYAVIAISFIVGGSAFISSVFGFSGATIGAGSPHEAMSYLGAVLFARVG